MTVAVWTGVALIGGVGAVLSPPPLDGPSIGLVSDLCSMLVSA